MWWIFKRKKTRLETFYEQYNEDERTAIINALFRRAKDDSDGFPPGGYNDLIKYNCNKIAMELMGHRP